MKIQKDNYSVFNSNNTNESVSIHLSRPLNGTRYKLEAGFYSGDNDFIAVQISRTDATDDAIKIGHKLHNGPCETDETTECIEAYMSPEQAIELNARLSEAIEQHHAKQCDEICRS